MTSLSDTLTVGLVLVLLFGSIALYLYTRIQQAEQKISLLESILLDMKMSMEIKSFTNLPADDLKHEESSTVEHYAPFTDEEPLEDNTVFTRESIKRNSPAPSVSSRLDEQDDEVEQYKSAIAEAVNDDELSATVGPVSEQVTTTSVNYEPMTLKELQALAKSRGITGAGSMKKGPIIEALKTSDRSRSTTVEPGSLNNVTGSFLETSSPFQTTG